MDYQDFHKIKQFSWVQLKVHSYELFTLLKG